MADLQALSKAVIDGDRDEVVRLTEGAVEEGVGPESIVNDGLIVGMDEVGRRFKANEFYVPEVLIAARAMHGGMDIVKPLLTERGIDPKGRVLIGTAQGDLHDIGKNLVAMMLEGGGYEVIDAGVDVAADAFVAAINDQSPHILALSALLTTTMPSMGTTIEALVDAGVRDEVKVIIGGAPITQAFADEIGADGYAPDAASAVELASELIAAG